MQMPSPDRTHHAPLIGVWVLRPWALVLPVEVHQALEDRVVLPVTQAVMMSFPSYSGEEMWSLQRADPVFREVL